MNIFNYILSKLSIYILNAKSNTYQSNILDLNKIDSSAVIKDAYLEGDIEIGENVIITKGVYMSGKIKVDKFTSISGPNTDFYSKINEISIGKFCSIARNVSFQEYYHKTENISTSMINNIILNKDIIEDINSKGKIELGNDVWIGTQCVILSGVKIGDGAIIASNSVVNKDIPDYAIAAGSPAIVIKYRFNEKTIRFLKEIKWWNWSIEKIKKNSSLFNKKIDDDFIEKFNELMR